MSSDEDTSSDFIYDPSIKVTSCKIESQTPEYFEKDGVNTECSKTTISWTVSQPFKYMKITNLSDNSITEVPSEYSGMVLYAEYSVPYHVELEPVTDRKSGEPYYFSFTPEKFMPIVIPEQTLEEGFQEIDCDIKSGSYKIEELTNTKVKLNNAKNSTIYLVQLNTSSRTLSSNRGVLISSASNNYESVRSMDSTSEQNYYELSPDFLLGTSTNNNSADTYDTFEISTSKGKEIITRVNHHNFYLNPEDVTPPEKHFRSADDSTGPVDFEIGDSKTVYIVNTKDENLTSEATAYLQYKSDRVYVWAAKENLTDGEPGLNKVNRKLCEDAGKILDSIIDLEKNIFGEEYNYLVSASTSRIYPMATTSETGEKINLLLYDIYGDYVPDNKSGTYGFFTATDYYEPGTKSRGYTSNAGKFLHVDSGFMANKDTRKFAFSTIVHELQHMIHYGQKRTYEQRGFNIESTYFHEMFSQLAEDMFQTKLELDDDNSAKSRFKTFLTSWNKLPYFTWNTDYLIESYANAFAIGLFVAKKYGGADFVYDYMHTKANVYTGLNSFMEAIYKNDGAATLESVMLDYCVELCAANKIYNKTVYSTEHVFEGYNYPMTAFNLRALKYPEDSATSGLVFNTLSGANKQFKSNSIDITKVTKVTDNSETLKFYGTSTSGLKEYLIIVK